MTALSEKRLQIREFIKGHSPFDETETNQILEEWFSSVATLVKIVIQNHQFDKKKVLDVGCAYGASLLYFGDGSEGVEIQGRMAHFLRSLRRTIYRLNVEDGFSGLRPASYDAVYSAAVIEHLVSPHLFLARLHSLLKPKGMLAISYPILPPLFFQNLWEWVVGYRGWLAVEHLSFFTPKTSRLMLERAGFEVLNQYSPAFYRFPILRKVNKIFNPIGMSCLSVCRKIDGFKYPTKRQSGYDPGWGVDLRHFR